MRELRNTAASSRELIDGGKKGMGKVKYRHTTETLAVSRLSISMHANFTDENNQKLHRCHIQGQVNGVDRLDEVLGRLGIDDKDIK